MTKQHDTRLALEAIEDRCLPSTYIGDVWVSPGEVAHSESLVHQEEILPRRSEPEPHIRMDAFSIGFAPTMTLGSFSSSPVRPVRPFEFASIPELSFQAAAAATARTLSVAAFTDTTTSSVRPAPAAAPVPRPADSAPQQSPEAPRPPTATAESAAVGIVFLGGVAASELPEILDHLPLPPVVVSALPELPTPREVVEKVIEAILPDGVPIEGVIPVDVDTGAVVADLIARLPALNPDTKDGWESPERWAWITASVLVAGVAAYSTRGLRSRRIVAPALGTESSLARWEDRRA